LRLSIGHASLSALTLPRRENTTRYGWTRPRWSRRRRCLLIADPVRRTARGWRSSGNQSIALARSTGDGTSVMLCAGEAERERARGERARGEEGGVVASVSESEEPDESGERSSEEVSESESGETVHDGRALIKVVENGL